MYLPPPYTETRLEEIHHLVQTYPLGSLVTNGPNGLDANHIPFEFHPNKGPHGTLLAHVARANPVWQEIENGSEVLVIFRAADAYLSPNWYPTKHETHQSVPTWNYQVVHAHGSITFRDDTSYVRNIVARLTHQHENQTEAHPWKMTDATPDYLARMLTSIVGLEIEITRLIGKSKLSQNREPRDRLSAADALHNRGKHILAEAMRNAP